MLHFTELLEPISASAPSGEDMTFSTELDVINAARQFDDPLLDQGEWVVALKEADWQYVYDNCARLLKTKTKDMRLAGWLTEAAAKTRHFAGLAAGFELLANLCDQYWDSLFPLIEDNDVEQRVGNLAWLLSRSVQLVKEVALTQGRDSSYSWIDFETARSHANTGLRQGDGAGPIPGQLDIAVLDAARRKSSKDFFLQLIEGALHCQAMLLKLEASVDARLGLEGPSFRTLKDLLSTIVDTVQRYAKEAGVNTGALEPARIQPVATAAAAAAGVATNTQPVAGDVWAGITTRDQALEQLRLVAAFFRRTEPHSPVAYLADKAAHWGELPLHSWLKTVVKDPVSLASIEEMLGITHTVSPD